jgi:di/tripeptidase
LADRLLADALRLAEIPSPTRREEQRAAFVLERLNSLGFVPRIDDEGNVLARIHSAEVVDEPPLLLFSDLGSKRWHPLESLSRLDALHAAGAGLGDVLGAAALLSVAETLTAGGNICRRDLLLLFAARSFDDPETDVFHSITKIPMNRPCAAIGLQGFTLGSVRTHTQGTYRITISLSLIRKKTSDSEEPLGPNEANMAVDALLSIAQKLSLVTEETNNAVHLYIRRLEAGTGFGHTPSEGLLEIELESSDASLLDNIRNHVTAVAEGAAAEKPLKITVDITSFIPVGDPSVTAELFQEIREIMKDMRIKINEENGSDPSAFLSHQGIPALSLGVVYGQEGLLRDTIEIASIEKGRLLLERIISQVPKEKT